MVVSLTEWQKQLIEVSLGARPAAAPDEANQLIYKNNVESALVRALEITYPVTARLVGEAFFRQMARKYNTAHPPTSMNLDSYGLEFPEFIAGYAPAASLPYLGEVASLERAMHSVLHAENAPTLPQDTLAHLEPEAFASLVLAMHPAVRVLRCEYPALSIWEEHQKDEMGFVDVNAGRESALVQWRGGKLVLQRLNMAEAVFLQAICDGSTLFEAFEEALGRDEGFDLEFYLKKHIVGGTFCHAGRAT